MRVAGVLARLVAGVCALALLAVIILMLAMWTEDGRRILVDVLTRLMAQTAGVTLKLEGLESGLPAHIAFDHLSLADTDGVWLKVDRFRLDWRPLALLTRRLEIDGLGVGDLFLARLPASAATPAAQEGGGFAWGPLPLRPVIHAVDIARLGLGAPILGRPVTVTVNASLTPAGAEGDRLAFDIAEIDGGASRLSLQGSGALADWRGQLRIEVPEAANVTASVNLAVGDQAILRVDGDGDVSAMLPPDLRSLAEPAVHAAATLVLSDDDRLTISGLRLAVPAATIDGEGVVDLTDTSVAADLKLAIDGSRLPVSLLGPLAIERATANLALHGPLDAPTGDIEATVQRFAAAPLSAERVVLSARIDPKSVEGAKILAIEGNAAAETLKAEPQWLQALIGPNPALSFAAAIDTAANTVRIEQATLEARSATARLTGAEIAGDQRASGRLHLEVADLARIGAIAGFPLSGAGSADIDAAGSLAEGNGTASASLALRDLKVGEPAVDALLGNAPTASLNLRLAGERRFEVSELAVRGQAITASGQGALDAAADSVDGEVRIRLPDLAPVLAAADTFGRGEATFEIRVAGSTAQPRVSVDGRLRGTVADVGIRSARLQLAAEDLLAAPAGRLSLDGETTFGSARLSTAFGLEGGQNLRFSGIEVRTTGAAISGNAVVPLTGAPIQGRLSGELRAASAPLVVSSLSIGGTGDLAVELSEREGQGLDIGFTGERLRVAENGDELAAAGTLKAEAKLASLLTRPRGTLSIESETVSAGSIAARHLTVSGSGSLDDVSANATVVDPAGRRGRLETAAHLRRNGEDWRIDIPSLRGRLEGHEIATTTPVSVVVGPRRIAAERFAVTVDTGRIEGGGRWSPAVGVEAEVSGNRLPLELTTLFVPDWPVRGKAMVEARVWTADRQMQGDFTLGLSHVRFGEAGNRIGEEGSASASASWRDGVIGAQAEANLPHVATAKATASLPFAFDPTRLQHVQTSDRQITGDIQARASLKRLSALLPLDGQQFCGDLAGRIAVAGTLERPVFDGRVAVTDARYENLTTGTVLDRGDVEMVLAGGNEATLTINARDGGEGRLHGEGRIALPDEGTSSANLTLVVDDATLVRRDDVTATSSGTVSYTGSLQTGELRGSIETSSVEVRLLDKLPPSVVDLKVVEVGGPEKSHSVPPPDTPSAWSAKLDLVLNMPRRIFVRGRGLDAEWEGRFDISGTTEDPVVNGNLSLVRGFFEFAGKRFVLTRGNIQVFGNGSPDARLDVAAEYKARELTATITLTGTASAPKIHLTADRDLPESEILAQVLFDKSSARLGPVEAVQLASALQSLTSGRSMSDDALSFVRTLLGLDTLSVGGGSGEDGGGASVSAGRYIGESVYVSGTQSSDTGSQSGSVSVEIAPGLSIESQVGQEQEQTTGSVGLRWRWDY